MCKDLMLVIEVDGYSHWSREAKEKDKKRECDLRLSGFAILRFTDEEVLNNIVQVEQKISNWIEEKEKQNVIRRREL